MQGGEDATVFALAQLLQCPTQLAAILCLCSVAIFGLLYLVCALFTESCQAFGHSLRPDEGDKIKRMVFKFPCSIAVVPNFFGLLREQRGYVTCLSSCN